MDEDIEQLSVNEWVKMFSRIYYQSQNFDKTPEQISLHLLEAVTSLRQAIFKYKKWDQVFEKWLPKVFAWFCALVKSVNVEDLSDKAWHKFPGICPFCADAKCSCELGEKDSILNRGKLAAVATKNKNQKPRSLDDWIQMLNEIYSQKSRGLYPAMSSDESSTTYDLKVEIAILKLYEEIVEHAEAYRVRAFYPKNIINELVDVFITICGLTNVLSKKYQELYSQELELNLLIWNRYPESCDTCRQPICICTSEELQVRLSNEGINLYEPIDDLTDIGNRAKYEKDRENFVKKVGNKCLILFDLDDFKTINDQSKAKHKQGDFVLQNIAERGRESLEGDDEIYRIGGDEFVILINKDNSNDLKKYCEDIFEKLTSEPVKSISKGENDFNINLSMGVAMLSEDDNAESAHDRADNLMYKSKESGKNKICYDNGFTSNQ